MIKEIKNTEIYLPSFVCCHCKNHLLKELSASFCDLKFEVDLENKNIKIFGEDFDLKEVIKKIEEIGYLVER